MKFISVTIPEGCVAISNGILTEVASTNNNQKIYTWKEEDPNPAYLTSLVIGKFYEYIEKYNYNVKINHNPNNGDNESVDLLYYVPLDKTDTLKRSFEGTSNMMSFFESYFNIKSMYEVRRKAEPCLMAIREKKIDKLRKTIKTKEP